MYTPIFYFKNIDLSYILRLNNEILTFLGAIAKAISRPKREKNWKWKQKSPTGYQWINRLLLRIPRCFSICTLCDYVASQTHTPNLQNDLHTLPSSAKWHFPHNSIHVVRSYREFPRLTKSWLTLTFLNCFI